MTKFKIEFEKIMEEEIKLDEQDKDFLAQLYVDPKYKSLVRLIDSVILDLQNRGFRDAEKLEEFLAIKWTRAALALIKNTIRSHHNTLTNKQNEKLRKEATEFEGSNFKGIESSEEQL
jgi:hypothetical protein